MAVVILLVGTLSFIMAGITSFVIMPIFYEVKNNENLWDNVTGDALERRDELYAIAQYWPFIGAAMIVFWMFRSATRRSTTAEF